MRPASFCYLSPSSIDDALDALADHGDDAKIIAGGQSLVPLMNFRLAKPAVLVDVNAIGGLPGLAVEGDRLVVGATTRHADFHRRFDASPLAALMMRMASHIAHYPIRQRGTFVGSLAHADPASEWCLLAMTLGANMEIRSRRGVRVAPAETFLQGALTTDLNVDEMVTCVRVPHLGEGWTTGFCEVSRRKGDFALGMALACLRIVDEIVVDARLGAAGVGPRAVRLETLERALIGRRADAALLDATARQTTDHLSYEDLPEASLSYRRALSSSVMRRALLEAASMPPRPGHPSP